MNNQTLLQQIKDGKLPKAGILRRTGAAKGVTVTTIVDGQRQDVPDVELTTEDES